MPGPGSNTDPATPWGTFDERTYELSNSGIGLYEFNKRIGVCLKMIQKINDKECHAALRKKYIKILVDLSLSANLTSPSSSNWETVPCKLLFM